MSIAKCPICESPAIDYELSPDIGSFNCSRCGPFNITPKGNHLLAKVRANPEIIGNISGYIFAHLGIVVDEEKATFLLSLRSLSISEKANLLFQFITKRHPKIGATFYPPDFAVESAITQINIAGSVGTREKFYSDGLALTGRPDEFYANCDKNLKWLSCASISDGPELKFIVRKILIEERRYLEVAGQDRQLSITPKGWDYLSNNRDNASQSTTAFVAMWFHNKMDHIYNNAIYQSISDAGFTPSRIDGVHHNNRIDDEIKVRIKECKFLVADFTGWRGGVYFEAGFALGLGKPVIWTVKKTYLRNIHFDVRQYAFITWTENDLPAFRKQLLDRIKLTIGKGPKAL